MEKTQPQLISTAAPAPARGENAIPFAQQTVVLTKQDYIALKMKRYASLDWPSLSPHPTQIP
jgi:hypothetical protein